VAQNINFISSNARTLRVELDGNALEHGEQTPEVLNMLLHAVAKDAASKSTTKHNTNPCSPCFRILEI
jgi:hypothetical protein